MTGTKLRAQQGEISHSDHISQGRSCLILKPMIKGLRQYAALFKWNHFKLQVLFKAFDIIKTSWFSGHSPL